MKKIIFFPGEAERERVHAAVPLRRFLRLPEAEGAGVQEHRLDLGVRRAEAQGQDRQLHSHPLNTDPTTLILSLAFSSPRRRIFNF